jgi:preprotein translocase subunit SecF
MKQQLNKKNILVLILVGLIIAGGVFFVHRRNETTEVEQPGGVVKLAPPTEQERAEANKKKDELVKQQQAIDEQSQQSGKKTVVPVITNADQNGLNAYVSGVYEDTGTCTATVSQGSASFVKTSQGFKDATTTGCSAIDFSGTDFTSKGIWSVTLKYDSPTATGSSSPVTFTVK